MKSICIFKLVFVFEILRTRSSGFAADPTPKTSSENVAIHNQNNNTILTDSTINWEVSKLLESLTSGEQMITQAPIPAKLSPTISKPAQIESKNLQTNEIIVDEVCSADENNSTEVATRKERLLCALLKVEMEKNKMLQKSSQSTPEKDDDSTSKDASYFLPKTYNKENAPQVSHPVKSQNGTVTHVKKPLTCWTFFNVRSVRDVDETKEEITLDMDILLVWIDGHIYDTLRKKNVTLAKFTEIERNLKPMKSDFVEKIWLPDIFFEEVVSVGRPIVLDKAGRNVFFNPQLGAIVLRLRLLVTLHCDMNFVHYPSDTQKCQFHIRSGSQPSSALSLKWWRGKGTGVFLHETSDPNFDYRVSSIKEYDEAIDYGPETRPLRPSSYLWFEICIRRKMSYHLLQTYLPSAFFLIVTWLCFLIPSKLFEARVGVAMTTLLTQTSMFSSIRENTPVVGYVKAIDIWMVTCIFFIFVALFAFVCETWVRHIVNVAKAEMEEIDKKGNRLRSSESLLKTINFYSSWDKAIEKCTGFALLIIFVLFNIWYWCWLLTDSEHLNWSVNETYNYV